MPLLALLPVLVPTVNTDEVGEVSFHIVLSSSCAPVPFKNICLVFLIYHRNLP